MTHTRAVELGIWTRWEIVSCQVCGIYTKYADLIEHSCGIICPKCEKAADRKADEKRQSQLFDDQVSMF